MRNPLTPDQEQDLRDYFSNRLQHLAIAGGGGLQRAEEGTVGIKYATDREQNLETEIDRQMRVRTALVRVSFVAAQVLRTFYGPIPAARVADLVTEFGDRGLAALAAAEADCWPDAVAKGETGSQHLRALRKRAKGDGTGKHGQPSGPSPEAKQQIEELRRLVKRALGGIGEDGPVGARGEYYASLQLLRAEKRRARERWREDIREAAR